MDHDVLFPEVEVPLRTFQFELTLPRHNPHCFLSVSAALGARAR